MNLLRFLKSTKGAIKPLNALLVSGAAGAAFFYVANTAAQKHIEAERSVRTLTSISTTSPQEGLHRQGGLLTSINVRDGRNELATAEERAAMGGNTALERYAANQRALGNMDANLGRAAQFGESDGLNVGNRELVQTTPGFVAGSSYNPAADVAGAVGQAQPGTAGEAGVEGGRTLAAASMARASGSNLNAASGPVAGGTAGGAGASPTRAAAPAVGERPRLSGAMPGGTNIVSRMGLE